MTCCRSKPLVHSALAILLFGVLTTGALAKEGEVVTAESVGLSSARLSRLGNAMQDDVNQGNLAGIVVLVARHGSIAYHRAFGMADIESDIEMQTDHLFRMYSMIKPITSTALLTLYEEGKFQLADPLEKYIPAFKDVEVFRGVDENGALVLEPPKRKITIQDVFRHTAGFSYGSTEEPIDRAYLEAGIDFGKIGSLKDLVDTLATLPLLYQPGERWVYSVSHDVQAYLVEHFSGMPFDEYVRTKLFQPLGMKDSFFGIPDDYVHRFTTVYGPGEGGGLQAIDKPERSHYARYTDHPFGGIGLSSTAMDYYLFAQMLLNRGKLDTTRILGKKTVELMISNNLPAAVPDLAANLGPIFRGVGYGLGVSVLLDPAQSGNLGSPGQFGWGGAATTWVIIDPQEDMISIYLTQYMPMESNFVSRFQTLVYQAIIE